MNKFYTLIIIAAVLLSSCRKEKGNFKGTDNFIGSFTLNKSGTTFHAVFSDSLITMIAPDGFSLDSAQVQVQLSENATIYPDPKTITEWNDEMIFVVTARNGMQKAYKYTVERSSIYTAESIVLSTQAEVEAFGELGITEIGGNLIIGRAKGTDSITSLAPLYKLKKIRYSLTVYPTYSAAAFVGLDNLSSIGGDIRIEGVNALENISLPALVNVNSIMVKSTAFLVVDFASLEKVEKDLILEAPLSGASFPALREVGGAINYYSGTNQPTGLPEVFFSSLQKAESLSFVFFTNVAKIRLPELIETGNFNMLNLRALYIVSCPKLERVTGLISIPEVSKLTEIEFPKLAELGGLTTSLKSLYSIEMPKLTVVNGDLRVSNAAVDGIKSLSQLVEVKGELFLGDLARMTGSGLPALLKKIKTLTLFNRTVPPPAQIDIRGLNLEAFQLQVRVPVKLIGDEIFKGTLIINPDALTTYPTLEGFREVDSLGFGGYISAINDLEIKGIKRINKGFWIPNNNVLTFSMPDLEEVAGDFTINNFQNLTQSDLSFPALKKVGGNMNVQVESWSVTRLQFPLLQEVNGDCTIGTGFDDRSLNQISFPALENVGGQFTVYAEYFESYGMSNTVLTNLDGFASLKQAAAVKIAGNSKLTSYEGIKNVLPVINASNWSATGNEYNPTYADLQSGAWIKP